MNRSPVAPLGNPTQGGKCDCQNWQCSSEYLQVPIACCDSLENYKLEKQSCVWYRSSFIVATNSCVIVCDQSCDIRMQSVAWESQSNSLFELQMSRALSEARRRDWEMQGHCSTPPRGAMPRLARTHRNMPGSCSQHNARTQLQRLSLPFSSS